MTEKLLQPPGKFIPNPIMVMLITGLIIYYYYYYYNHHHYHQHTEIADISVFEILHTVDTNVY